MTKERILFHSMMLSTCVKKFGTAVENNFFSLHVENSEVKFQTAFSSNGIQENDQPCLIASKISCFYQTNNLELKIGKSRADFIDRNLLFASKIQKTFLHFYKGSFNLDPHVSWKPENLSCADSAHGVAFVYILLQYHIISHGKWKRRPKLCLLELGT